MPRIQGVDLPNRQAGTYIALTFICTGWGGPRRSRCAFAARRSIRRKRRLRKLSEDEISYGSISVSRQGSGDRRAASPRSVQQDIARLREISLLAMRASGIAADLPVRGQRTRTNARTRKGVKKTVAGKKGVKEMR